MSYLVLVNEADEAIGTMEKMEVHQKGLLHRAFSVFIFNKKGEMLLQQRADNKYHSPGLWTNACCSHPLMNEAVKDAAVKRLKEELGFTTELTKAFSFTYRAEFDNGLTEHEFDHVFLGTWQGDISPDPREVKDHCYMTMEAIATSMAMQPQRYTSWFKIAFPKMLDYLAVNSLQQHGH